MKFPKLPQIKIPKWLSNFSFSTIFQSGDSPRAFYHVWKKFLGQIPRESRPAINSYQHFIVLGNSKSGKTNLIQGLIEQSQDLYPFDTSYCADPDVQFYLGPNQVIQELSFAALEDKSIRGRRKTIKLWKKLYVRREPIIIIAYDCLSNQNGNLKDLNRLAQLIAGKVSLLSEITKKPLKVRIALTHLDQVSGYLEFARFLKQENLTFEINLSTNFESNTLDQTLKKFFEDNITLLLLSSSNRDFTKMLAFSKDMPSHFLSIEEFLRVLVSRVSFANSIELDTLSFTSNQESSTSFNPFKWTRLPSMEIFFRYPLLKHQIAAAAIFVLFAVPLFYFFFTEKNEFTLAQKGVDQLNLLQYKNFEDKLIPNYVDTFEGRKNDLLAYVQPSFFGEKLDGAKDRLAGRMKKHYIEKSFRKAILENQAELKCLYFKAIINATANNRLGKFILTESKNISKTLNLDENILKAYIHSRQHINDGENALFDFAKVNPYLPFTSYTPWLNFFTKIHELCDQQIYGGQNFEEIVAESHRLKGAIVRLQNDPLAHSIANVMVEEYGEENVDEPIQVIAWIGDNNDSLINFLQFIQDSSTAPEEIQKMNIAQFFTKLKEISLIKDRDNIPFDFSIGKQNYSFHTEKWVDLVIAHNVERAIQKYIVFNNKTNGEIFFKNSTDAQAPLIEPAYHGDFPVFFSKITIPGKYSRVEYENKVRATTEKLAHWIDTLAVNPEDKKRFITFLVHEVLGYVQVYGDYYDQYFQQCDIQDVSLPKLKRVLLDISQDTSSFHQFLKFVYDETNAFSEPVLSLKNMKELNQFDFLNTLLTVDKEGAPYSKYQKLMADLAHDLNWDLSSDDASSQESFRLTSIAKVSSNILQNNSESYLRRTQDCLHELGVPEKYQKPFLKPIYQLYKLGVPDLKECIERVWATNFEMRIDNLLSKFPFNSNGNETLTIEEVENTLSPNSLFFKTVTDVMGTCSKNIGGTWVPLDSELLQINETIFAKLNHIQKLSDLLWDSTGTPQALNLTVQAVPFTNESNMNPIIVLSYLISGEQSIRNLNQTPTLQPLKLEWWKANNCSVGVELMNKYTNNKSYKCNQKMETPWGFFELMREAQMNDENRFTWMFESDGGKGNYAVSFSFVKNPLNLFQE